MSKKPSAASQKVFAKPEDSRKFTLKTPLTELLIQAEHERCAHQGAETVLNNLRKMFWIVDGRQTVLLVSRQCWVCRLCRGAPIISEMGLLPHYRWAACQASFTITGLDFFEPITVTIGRQQAKRWGAIFTCLVTRGINLEVAHGLSTDEALMALSRFIDTRGRPFAIYSDNGTNFVGASREMKIATQHIDFNEIAASGRFREIEWKSNRYLRRSNYAGPAIPSKINATDNNLRNQLKRAQILADQFWIKWTRDYIPKLAARNKWRERTEHIRIGDLVFLVDKQHPRNMWKRGFISDVRLGKDEQVRMVRVITK
ncbi:hypothetical protein LAZ67_19001882 [Cordylochernes scorpioides]|uniref:Integrase catalytic domain-containing protein n=1 Tax=Cordylochernes scorpioides TaxID=51811 RepID=A0ABY6LJQ1_9ARAC|nr:hypothetical protein LAZ67_19001882 [Cordylochernes scorpioides]